MKNLDRINYDGSLSWVAPAEVSAKKNVHFRARRKTNRIEFGDGILQIAAESFYALYVNGRFVANGPARGTYACNFVDSHDINSFLCDEQNYIAVEIFCNNYPTFISSPAEPALFAAVGNIITDESWEVQIATDWRADVPKYTLQIGSMEWRDMSGDPLGWMIFEDDSDWLQAKVISSEKPIYSKTLFMRDVCGLKVSEVSPAAVPVVAKVSAEFECDPNDLAEFITNEKFMEAPVGFDVAGLTQGEAVKIEPLADGGGVAMVLDFGQAIIGELQLDIDAPAGAILDVSYDEFIEGGKLIPQRHQYKFADRYILRQGRQMVSNPLHWRGGRYVQLILRNFGTPITISRAAFIDRRYPIDQPAEFSCSDESLNATWQKCLATMSACATDTFLDCPWREMSFWVNDFVVQQEFWQQLVGQNDLVKRSFSLALSQPVTDGLVPGVCPFDGNEELVLFPTNLFLAMILRDYRHYTGDENYVDAVIAEVEKIFNICQSYADDDGLLVPPKTYWNFTDWSYWLCKDHKLMVDGEFDVRGTNMCIVNWFNCHAANSLAELFTSRDADKAQKYANIAKNSAKAIVDKFWDEELNCFRELPDLAAPASKITHALALISGHLPENLIQPCREALYRDDCLTPELYMMHFVFKALAAGGDYKTIMKTIEKYWQPIAESDCPTIWEANVHEHAKASFLNAGSMCHAFALAPVSVIQQEILGIKPLDNGYSTFSVEPNMCGLDFAKGKVPTPHGFIEIVWKKCGSSINVDLCVPTGGVALCSDGRKFVAGRHEFEIAIEREI